MSSVKLLIHYVICASSVFFIDSASSNNICIYIKIPKNEFSLFNKFKQNKNIVHIIHMYTHMEHEKFHTNTFIHTNFMIRSNI